jgi:hypothetical protein
MRRERNAHVNEKRLERRRERRYPVIELSFPFKQDPQWATLPDEVRDEINRQCDAHGRDSSGLNFAVPGYEPVRAELVPGWLAAQRKLDALTGRRPAARIPGDMVVPPRPAARAAAKPARPVSAPATKLSPLDESRDIVRKLEAMAAKGDESAQRELGLLADKADADFAQLIGLGPRKRQRAMLAAATGTSPSPSVTADAVRLSFPAGATNAPTSRPRGSIELQRAMGLSDDASRGAHNDGARLVLG